MKESQLLRIEALLWLVVSSVNYPVPILAILGSTIALGIYIYNIFKENQENKTKTEYN